MNVGQTKPTDRLECDAVHARFVSTLVAITAAWFAQDTRIPEYSIDVAKDTVFTN